MNYYFLFPIYLNMNYYFLFPIYLNMNYYFLFPIYLINFYAKFIVNYQLVRYPLYREAPSTTGKSRRPTHSGVF
jgi:hypothetical protein